MTALETMTDCPNEETLAAFIDDRLTGDERTRVLAHLAQCGDCRDLVWLAVDVKAEEVPPANVKPFTSRRKWIVTSLVAAAAAVAVFVAVPLLQSSRDPLRGLIETSATLEKRPVQGRLAGFPYRPARENYRGGGDPNRRYENDDFKILTVAGKVEEDLGDDQSTKARHALAVAYLVSQERQQAMVIASATLRKDSKTTDLRTAVDLYRNARLLNDFSVVALANGEYELALRAAERSNALAPTAEAMWNRAEARQALDRKPIEAWQDYLRIDPHSQWSVEAQKNITPPDL